jgi:hypothetical protein
MNIHIGMDLYRLQALCKHTGKIPPSTHTRATPDADGDPESRSPLQFLQENKLKKSESRRSNKLFNSFFKKANKRNQTQKRLI